MRLEKREIEVCTFSLDACRAAQRGGADRIELCAAMYEGGITPSAATICMARELLEIELYVMIRPRGGDFLYSEEEFELMKRDIVFAGEQKADGVVVGLLKADGRVDVERLRELVELAAPMKVTFHRAFDMTRDYREALEDVIAGGCYRILTSGLHNTAPEGVEVLRELVMQAAGRIRIMAGSGVSADNAEVLLEAGVDALHLSGKAFRDSGMVYRNPAVSMGGVPGISEYEIVYCDEEKVRRAKG